MSEQDETIFDFATGQSDLFAGHAAHGEAVAQPDLAMVRKKLQTILDDARAAESGSPWDERATRKYLILFPQMSSALPSDEATQLQSAFTAELVRLGIAA